MQIISTVLLAVVLSAPMPPESGQDIKVTYEGYTKCKNRSHGYTEHLVTITNVSKTNSHEVRIVRNRSFIKNLKLTPDTTRTEVLYGPPFQDAQNSNIKIITDGKSTMEIETDYDILDRSAKIINILLTSKTTVKLWPKQLNIIFKGINFSFNDLPDFGWPTTWLGYTQYEGAIMGAIEYSDMAADRKNAMLDYIRAGGSLVLVEDGPLPGEFSFSCCDQIFLKKMYYGFGIVLTLKPEHIIRMIKAQKTMLNTIWHDSGRPWFHHNKSIDVKQAIPIVKNRRTTINRMIFLLLVFAILAGPVNIYALLKRKQLALVFITLPILSAVFSIAVFIYGTSYFGWHGQGRFQSFTLLDQSSHKAVTIGWAGYLHPHIPKNGLLFEPDTEIALPQQHYHTNSIILDLTEKQRLIFNNFKPRVPVYFQIRQMNTRRERLDITFNRNAGTMKAVNGLGADIERLYLADDSGLIHTAVNIPAGMGISLEKTAKKAAGRADVLRRIYAQNWLEFTDIPLDKPAAYLQPGTYIAILKDSPLFEIPLENLNVQDHFSIIYGIFSKVKS